MAIMAKNLQIVELSGLFVRLINAGGQRYAMRSSKVIVASRSITPNFINM
jgi:hypothetical protein